MKTINLVILIASLALKSDLYASKGIVQGKQFVSFAGKKKKFNPKPSNLKSTTKKWTLKLQSKTVNVHGSFNDFSKPKIKQLLSDGIELSGPNFQTYLMNSRIFDKLIVKTSGDVVDIYIVECPILAKWDVHVSGAPKPKLEHLTTILDLTPRSHIPDDKIRLVAQALKTEYMAQCGTSKVDVKVERKIIDSGVEIHFYVEVEPEKAINSAVFIGNKKLSTKLLYSAIKLQPKSMSPLPFLTYKAIAEEEAEATATQLVGLANSYGFLDFQVKSITIEENESKNKFLMIVVEEGPEYKVTDVKLDLDLDTVEHDKVIKRAQNLIKRINKGQAFKLSAVKDVSNSIGMELIKHNLFKYDLLFTYTKKDNHELTLTYHIKKQANPKKIRRINYVNNQITNDSTIQRYLDFEAGDIYSQFAADVAKASLLNSGICSNIEFATVDVPGSSDQVDLIITIHENQQFGGQIGLKTNTTDVFLNGSVDGKTNNFLGSGHGLSFDVGVGTMPNINIRFNFMVNKNVVCYADFVCGTERRNVLGLFRPSDLLEALLEAFGSVKCNTIDSLSTKLSGGKLTHNEQLKEQALDKFISPDWEEKKQPRGDQEFKTAIKFGCRIRADQNHSFFAELGMVNRQIQRASTDGKEVFNLFHGKDDDGEEALKTQANLKYYTDGTVTHNIRLRKTDEPGMWMQGKKKPNVYISQLGTRGVIENDLKNNPKLLKELQKNPDSEVEAYYRGLGRSPVLKSHPELNEKIEVETTLGHIYRDKIYQMDLPYSLTSSVTFVAGTTQAVKLNFTGSIEKQINEYLDAAVQITFGRSFNSHYLDNFTHSALGLCAGCGPVEVYDFTYLGGRSLFKIAAILNFNVFSNQICDIVPYIKIAFGSIWDSGFEVMRIDDTLCELRNWKKGTLNIAQNDFSLIGILTPGLTLGFGPLKVGLGINLKFLDQYPDLNKNSGLGGLDFSIGLNL